MPLVFDVLLLLLFVTAHAIEGGAISLSIFDRIFTCESKNSVLA
jgi:hypothetical protein